MNFSLKHTDELEVSENHNTFIHCEIYTEMQRKIIVQGGEGVVPRAVRAGGRGRGSSVSVQSKQNNAPMPRPSPD